MNVATTRCGADQSLSWEEKMNIRIPLAALAVLAITAGAAHATVFTGTDAFTDSTPGNALSLTAVYDLNPINFNLTAGNTFSTLDLLTIQSSDGANPFFGSATATDNIKVTFAFTAPSSGAGSTSGSGSETVVSFFGIITGSSGLITWDNPNTITFADGAILSVSLGDTNLSGTGTTKSGVVAATFTDVRDPTSVPEPMSLALLGSGLLGITAVRRLRRDPSDRAGTNHDCSAN
jgi:PEP-CTERM motif